ncbi:MAG: type II toxin-antitoxin system HipA family toxin [Acidobacteria bacterium]|nr:type II toxin-antitoxin system HipA family toxin [Acidobacteriota bacterium]
MTRALAVWWEDALVGSLRVDRDGEMRFAYDADWLADPASPALSFSLPKRAEPFRARACRPFFEGLLPEGAQRDAIAAVFGVSPGNEFALLERLGGDVAGALTLRREGEAPPPAPVATAAGGQPAAALDEQELAGVLGQLGTRPMLAGTRGLRLSLAGAQSKLPVVLVGGRVALPGPGQPTTHILKPPIARFPATTENEAFAMRLATRLGVDAAPVEAYRVADGHCLLVTRYDRQREADGSVRRLHQEDFCQALGVPSSRKYAADGGPAFRQCFDLVRRACPRPAVEVLKLLDAAIVQVLIGNADAHAKNYSLLHREGGPELAPLYDLLSTVSYPDLSPNLAMRVAGRATLRELHPGDWDRFAKSAGLAPPFVRRRVVALAAHAVERAEGTAGELAGSGLDGDALRAFAARVAGRARQLARTA